MTDTFPRQYARTQRLTLGEPRNVTVSPDGRRVVFLRSRGRQRPGQLPVGARRRRPARSGWSPTRCAARRRPRRRRPARRGAGPARAGPRGRRRHHRVRHRRGGAPSSRSRSAGRLFVGGLLSGQARSCSVDGPGVRSASRPARPRRVAYVSGRDAAHRRARRISHGCSPATDEPDTVTWGSADFIAAEEMGRYRGYWWSPDGDAHRRVPRRQRRRCSGGTSPTRPPRPAGRRPIATRPPAPPTPTSRCTSSALDGRQPPTSSGTASASPISPTSHWTDAGLVLLRCSPATSERSMVLDVDADHARRRPPCSPTTRRRVGRAGARHARRCSPTAALVRAPTATAPAGCSSTASRSPRRPPGALRRRRRRRRGHVPRQPDRRRDRPARLAVAHRRRLCNRSPTRPASTRPPSAGRRPSSCAGDARRARRDVTRSRRRHRPSLASLAEAPLVRRTSRSSHVGRAPPGHRRAAARTTTTARRCPVLLDPYGGPHAQRVVARRTTPTSPRSGSPTRASPSSSSTGAARPGAAASGSGPCTSTSPAPVARRPGRRAARPPPSTCRSSTSTGSRIRGLELRRLPRRARRAAPARRVPRRDRRRAGHRVAAVRHPLHRALPRRPERSTPTPYDRSARCSRWPTELTRPLLLIHGLADDNVVAAHTLQLSSALLAAGRPHEVLPLVGVTHMTPQEVVAENLLLHQLEFLRRSLPAT